MEPNAFVAEVYRRMSLRHSSERPQPAFAEIQNDARVSLAVSEYCALLPSPKDAAILDIGFGGGWIFSGCVKLCYGHLAGADFGIANKERVRDWAKGAIQLHEFENDIGDYLSQWPEHY